MLPSVPDTAWVIVIDVELPVDWFEAGASEGRAGADSGSSGLAASSSVSLALCATVTLESVVAAEAVARNSARSW